MRHSIFDNAFYVNSLLMQRDDDRIIVILEAN